MNLGFSATIPALVVSGKSPQLKQMYNRKPGKCRIPCLWDLAEFWEHCFREAALGSLRNFLVR